MELVLLTALGVGGATVIGALIGFIFKKISHNAYLTLITYFLNKAARFLFVTRSFKNVLTLRASGFLSSSHVPVNT